MPATRFLDSSRATTSYLGLGFLKITQLMFNKQESLNMQIPEFSCIKLLVSWIQFVIINHSECSPKVWEFVFLKIFNLEKVYFTHSKPVFLGCLK